MIRVDFATKSTLINPYQLHQLLASAIRISLSQVINQVSRRKLFDAKLPAQRYQLPPVKSRVIHAVVNHPGGLLARLAVGNRFEMKYPGEKIIRLIINKMDEIEGSFTDFGEHVGHGSLKIFARKL